MKRIIIVFVVLLSLMGKADATLIEFDGLRSRNMDGEYIPEGASYIGGPAGTNTHGYADRFSVTETYDINHLTMNALAFHNYEEDQSRLDFYIKLYTGSTTFRDYPQPVPDQSTLVLRSDIVKLSGYGDDYANVQYTNYRIPFVYTLPPGTYWLAYDVERSGGGTMVTNIETSFHETDLEGIHSPEPATMLLLAGGFIPFLRRRFFVS